METRRRRFGDVCIADCNRRAQSRGLCTVHYNVARLLVNEGKISWKKLALEGKAIVWGVESEIFREKAKDFFLGSKGS